MDTKILVAEVLALSLMVAVALLPTVIAYLWPKEH